MVFRYLALLILHHGNEVYRVFASEGGSNPGNGGRTGFATGGTRALEDIMRVLERGI